MFSTLRGARKRGESMLSGICVCCFAMHVPTPFRAGRAMYNPCRKCYIFLLFNLVMCWLDRRRTTLTIHCFHAACDDEVRKLQVESSATAPTFIHSDFRQDTGKVEFE